MWTAARSPSSATTSTTTKSARGPPPAGTDLQIAVRLYWSGHYLSSSYRLIVVGSGTALGATNISGDHVGRWR